MPAQQPPRMSAFPAAAVRTGPAPHPLAPKTPPPNQDSWVSFGTRLPKPMIRRLKVTAAVHGVSVQHAVHEAMTTWLETHQESPDT